MNWRAIRLALLLMLVALNLGLLAYNVTLYRERYVVPDERIALVQEQYLREGYILPDTLPQKQFPVKRLVLKKMDLEERADGFWNEEYEKSYMIGSKVLYTSGSEVLTLDRDTSVMHYVQNEPELQKGSTKEEEHRLAISFARVMMQEEALTLVQIQEGTEGADIYTFCQEYNEQLIFCNGISVTVYQGAVIEAYMQQYRIEGYDDEEQFIYPIDEVLFACLGEIGEREAPASLELFYGYDVVRSGENQYYGEPQILICYGNGRNLLVNQYTVEFNILQYR